MPLFEDHELEERYLRAMEKLKAALADADDEREDVHKFEAARDEFEELFALATTDEQRGMLKIRSSACLVGMLGLDLETALAHLDLGLPEAIWARAILNVLEATR